MVTVAHKRILAFADSQTGSDLPTSCSAQLPAAVREIGDQDTVSQSGSVPDAGRPRQPAGEADVIDFEIKGQEIQYIEIELGPGESMVAEAEAMMFKDVPIQMDTIFGDGSKQQSGILGSLMGTGKRLLTGEGLFMTVLPITVGARLASNLPRQLQEP